MKEREGYKRFLLPEVIAKIRSLDLKARLVCEGFLTGLHKSPFKGFSVEFSEYRPYIPGDDLRRIDWKVYGRTDRFYVREYEAETNLRAYLLLDASGSMAYSSRGISKFEYASYLGASLAYLLLKQRDSVGLLTFTTKMESFIPPSQSPAHLYNILKVLDNQKTGGETNLSETFYQLAQRIKRRGLIIILSDLFDDKEKVLSAIRLFRYKKHEVLVFQILDKEEKEFSFSEPAVFKDLETGKEITLDPRVLRKDYQSLFARFVSYYKRSLAEANVDYNLIFTDMPFDRALFAYLEKRSRFY
ncbi:MAG: DUF58 domain-containing protein [candidate division WOR-3 bacterium]